jgi:hypothetical protein
LEAWEALVSRGKREADLPAFESALLQAIERALEKYEAPAWEF